MIWQQTFIFLAQQPPRPASAGGPSILGSSSRTPSLEPAGRAASASRLLPRFLLAANLWTCPSWWCGWGWGLKVRRRAGWHRWDVLFVKFYGLVALTRAGFVVQLGKPSKSSPNFHFGMYPAHSVIIQSLVSWIKTTQQNFFGLTLSYLLHPEIELKHCQPESQISVKELQPSWQLQYKVRWSLLKSWT